MTPGTIPELAASLSDHHARGARLPDVDVRALRRVLAHTPEDLTVKVESGITLAGLQAHLATSGQWLPVDPPHAGRLTVRDVIERDLSGPRRCGFGTVREHLIGMAALLGDGRLIHSGGNVVKNVAGYDLQKLFIGSRGTLGIVVEAVFKVRPLPEAEAFVARTVASASEASPVVEAVQESPVTPVVFDLHNIAADGAASAGMTLVLGFSGTREDVAWQLEQAHALGFTEPASLEHEERFWSNATPSREWSVLPSKLCETLATLGNALFVARAANGVVFARGGPAPPKLALPAALLRRVKDTFDPKHVFPDPEL